jgi:hypothetical protein
MDCMMAIWSSVRKVFMQVIIEERTASCWSGLLSAPYASFAESFVKSEKPWIGRYSLSGLPEYRMCSA